MMKTALITGAGTRIGRALALGLSGDGWAVAIHYNRSRQSAKVLADQINKNGGNAAAVGANLNVPCELESLLPRSAEKLASPIAALINNASTFSPDTAQNFTPAGYEHHMSVNLKAPMRLSQHFARALPLDKNGVIINMIDQRVLSPHPSYFTYSLSKAALFAATKTLAQSFAPRIRVCGIGPGPTLQNKHQNAEGFATETSATLLGTGSPPPAILNALRYLLAASTVTGQMIAVDGGEHLNF